MDGLDEHYGHRKLMSEYYKDDGSVAKIYQVINGMDGEHSFFSITYKDAAGSRITHEDFKFKSLRYVEDAAENWTLGIKQLLTE
jgi:hypothetical protein|tara:strand:- start:2889 stop:3140 length:252 start_codon:yes stop_codon:yes gene_type:complete